MKRLILINKEDLNNYSEFIINDYKNGGDKNEG